ncbi:MAG: glycosyltransferase [Bacteroidales bacterium]|nr:glycosyltransferase [Bacteroidales bacterium]
MEVRKRILLVSNGFYPEISPRSFRATELAEEFARQGHDVTVYTKNRDFDYSDFLAKNKLTLKMWDRARFPAVPQFKGRIPRLLSRGLTRLLLMIFEYPAIEEMFRVKRALKNENGYDLMISFAVPFPVHWGVAWSRTKKHPIAGVWISDCGDPYMGNRTDSFKKLFYFKYIEKWWCRKTDCISIPVESARSAYYEEFQPKIIVIPQGLKFNNIDIKDIYVKNAVPTFAYTGMFIPGIRDPREFLDHLATLDQDFRFFIYTKDKNLLEPYRESLKGKMIVHDYIPRDELLNKLARMDFLVNFDNNSSVQIPSKLIDYKLTGRPVINVTKRFDKKTFLAFMNGDYTHAYQIGELDQYDIRNVATQFISAHPGTS